MEETDDNFSADSYENDTAPYECDNFENEKCLCHKQGECINLKNKKKED